MSPTTLSDDQVKARQQHICEDCGRKIEPGETYRRWKGVGDYGIYTWKSCEHCEALIKLILAADRYAYDADSGLDVREWLYEVAGEHGLSDAETAFLAHWRDSSGALLPIPVAAVSSETKKDQT